MRLRIPPVRLLAYCVALWVAIGAPGPAANAQPDLPAAGAVAEKTASGVVHPTHGWLAIPGDVGAVLVHVPPRRQGGWADGRAHGALDGTARRAMLLDSMPAAMGAIGDRVYLIFEQSTPAGEPVRRSVFSLLARPSAVGGYWYFEPEGHLNPHPSLGASGTLRAAVGTPAGLAVLIEGELPESGASLQLLRQDRWWDMPSPTAIPPGRTFLLATPEGLGLLTLSAQGGAELWVGTVRQDPAPAKPPINPFGNDFGDDQTYWPGSNATSPIAAVPMLWKKSTLAADGSLLELDLRRTRFFQVSGLMTYVTSAPDGMIKVGTVTDDTSFEIARLSGITERFAAVPLDAPGRVVLAWMAADEATVAGAARAKTHPELREISVFTGRVMYSGPGKGDAPVSAQEVQLLAGALVGIMTVVLFIVLRREPDDGAFHLPQGTSLAEPGRRFMASVLDLALVLLVASRLWEFPLTDLLVPVGLLSGQSLWVIGTALGLGLAVGTLSEWLTGRTLGKLITGCEVIDVRPREQVLHRPHFWQSLVRNAVKWLVPPVAVLGLMDSQGRHRGDSFARSAVVIRVEESPETPGNES
jgi:uncharacterized RDD family membrane protein YckC